MPSRVRLFWRDLWRRRRFEAEMEEELQVHLRCRAEDLRRSGLSQAEAARRARLEFGAVEGYKEDCRAARGLRWVDELLADLRYGWRGLAQSPGFTLVAVLTLSLAIGANTTLFSFLRAYMLKPLPIMAIDRNVQLAALGKRGLQDTWSHPDFVELKRHNDAFEALYAASSSIATLRGPAPRPIRVGLVSGNLFGLFGARLAAGRGLGPTDDEVPGRDAVLVLSHAAWRRLFAADPGIVGRTVHLNRTAFTVVGVAQASFTGSDPVAADCWAPLAMAGQLAHERGILDDRERGFLIVGGVLKPGVSLQQAHGPLASVVADIASRHRPETAMQDVVLTPWRTVFLVNADALQALAALFAGFGLVLLVACANLASLLLARAASRQRELAIRLAIGASRGRLVRQLLTENLLLSSLAAALGLGMTLVANGAIQRALFGSASRLGVSFEPVGPDWQAWLLTVALGVVAGIACGLAPALLASRSAPALSVRRGESSGGWHPPGRRLRNALLVGEVCASCVLLVTTGLLYRGAEHLGLLRHGYELDHAIDLRVAPTSRDLLRWLENEPRFESASEVSRTPLSGPLPRLNASIGGASVALGYTLVDHRYFDTLRIPLRRGRAISEAEARAEAKVAVVSETTAGRLWPALDPLGRTFRVAEPNAGGRVAAGAYQVIGVAADVVNARLDEGPDWTAAYLPIRLGDPRNGVLARVRADATGFLADVQNACFDLDRLAPCQPVLLSDRAWMQRLPVVVVRDVAAGVSLLALALCSIGLAGLVAYSAAQRRREIGVRMALGAQPRQVLSSMLRESARHVAIGIALGLPLSLALAFAASRLDHVAHFDTFDPLAYGLAPLALAAIALTACSLPARRATHVDPAIVLREE